MKILKYITVHAGGGQRAIVFDQTICHVDAVRDPSTVIAAGFVMIDKGIPIRAYGNSTSIDQIAGHPCNSRGALDRALIHAALHPGPWDYGMTQAQWDEFGMPDLNNNQKDPPCKQPS